MKGFLRVRALLLATLVIGFGTGAGCIRNEATLARCEISNEHQFTFHVDGVFFGAFEKYEVRGTEIILKNGILPPNPSYADWRYVGLNHPLMANKHDILLFQILSTGSIGSAVAEFIDARVFDMDGAPTLDVPNCLVIDRMVLKAGSVSRKPTGVWTNSR